MQDDAMIILEKTEVFLIKKENEYKTETTVGGSDDTTNNEMELLAAYNAVLKAYKNNPQNKSQEGLVDTITSEISSKKDKRCRT